MPKLTKRFIDALRPDPNGADLFAWDSELRGFAIRMKPSGNASFLVQYRTANRKTRRYAFGKVGTLTPEEARAKARRLLAGFWPRGQGSDGMATKIMGDGITHRGLTEKRSQHTVSKQ